MRLDNFFTKHFVQLECIEMGFSSFDRFKHGSPTFLAKLTGLVLCAQLSVYSRIRYIPICDNVHENETILLFNFVYSMNELVHIFVAIILFLNARIIIVRQTLCSH